VKLKQILKFESWLRKNKLVRSLMVSAKKLAELKKVSVFNVERYEKDAYNFSEEEINLAKETLEEYIFSEEHRVYLQEKQYKLFGRSRP
jgi:hypothetical protein